MHRQNSCWPEITAAIPGEHRLPNPDLFDGTPRAVGHRHQRPLNEALRIVADDHQVAVLAGEQLQPPVLGVVGVLVLVDEHVPEAVGVALADLGEQFQHVDRPDQQVVEVHRVHPVQLALV